MMLLCRHKVGVVLALVFSLAVNILAKPDRVTPKRMCDVARYYWIYKESDAEKRDAATQTEVASDETEQAHDEHYQKQRKRAEAWESNALLRIIACNCIGRKANKSDEQSGQRREDEIQNTREEMGSSNAGTYRRTFTNAPNAAPTVSKVPVDHGKDAQAPFNQSQGANTQTQPKPDEHPLRSFHIRRASPKTVEQVEIVQKDDIESQAPHGGARPKIRPPSNANIESKELVNSKCGVTQLVRKMWDEIPPEKRAPRPASLCMNYPAVTMRNPPNLPLNERVEKMSDVGGGREERKAVKSVTFGDINNREKRSAYKPGQPRPTSEYATPTPLPPQEFRDKTNLKGILRNKDEKRRSADCSRYDAPCPGATPTTSGTPRANANQHPHRQPSDASYTSISSIDKAKTAETLV